LSTIFRR